MRAAETEPRFAGLTAVVLRSVLLVVAWTAARFSLALAADSTEPPGAEVAPGERMGSASAT